MYRGRPRFIEGIRWLRSDGKPNFSNRVYRVESDLERLSIRPVYTTSPTAPLLNAVEKMYTANIRSLVVVSGSNRYEGMLLAEHVIDLLGGGEKYDMVINSFDNDFYKVIKAPVSIVFDKNYPYLDKKLRLTDALQTMIENGINVVPVVDDDHYVYGIISEHDIVALLAGKRTGALVRDIANPSVPTIESEASLREAMRLMNRTGLRAIFVRNEIGQIVGTIRGKDIIASLGSHKAFSFIKKGYIDDFTSEPVKEFSRFNALKVREYEDVGNAASLLIENDTPVALVVDDSEDVKGMLTEHDLFYALSFPLG